MDRAEVDEAGLGIVSFAAPRPLRPDDDLANFDCGRHELNDWLVRRALRSERERDARTSVTCATPGDRVAGYSGLSAFSVVRSVAPGALSRNAPDPIPAVQLGRLAVDLRFQGARLRASLLHDAVMNATTASRPSSTAGIGSGALRDNAPGATDRTTEKVDRQ